MNRLLTLILLPAALAAAGCASKASMDASYDASLQRWHGATRAELEAAWGRPTLASAASGNTLLTWVVRNDIDSHPGPDGAPVVIVSRSAGGGVGAGGTAVHTAAPGAPAPPIVPITCTTRFVLKDGHVASWTFDGLGCGAPY